MADIRRDMLSILTGINKTMAENASTQNTQLLEAQKANRKELTRAIKDFSLVLRNEFRCRWWKNPQTVTYKQISIEDLNLPTQPIENKNALPGTPYGEGEKPVFLGHYWLKGRPGIFRENICCLDYSVANRGVLAAYRFDGELVLEKGKLVWV